MDKVKKVKKVYKVYEDDMVKIHSYEELENKIHHGTEMERPCAISCARKLAFKILPHQYTHGRCNIGILTMVW